MADTAGTFTDRPQGPRDLADWLLARGRHWVTSDEAATLLGAPLAHVSPSLSRWRKKGLLFSPTKGVYVPIPPEYRSWGAVPASHFIDPLMRHLGHDYYVCLLTAAEAHGFAHQKPQQFQVMTPARLRDRSFGRVQLSFVTSSDTASRPTIVKNTPTGTMRLSTPEGTALDLVARPLSCGGLSNVATILTEMVEDEALDLKVLADLATTYPVAVAQRTGWLLQLVAEDTGTAVDLDALARVADQRSTPTPLEAYSPRRGNLDERWNVIVNGPIEPDR
ncbi:MAG: type IV toxin-antitoxin system AbiEi family antitoxin domain-containing protein [Acidimicrobiales bacterium]